MLKLFYLIIFLMNFCCKSAVVIPQFESRFGDKLSCIYYALCFSYKYNIDLFCPEFEYSHQIKIHDLIPKIKKKDFSYFKSEILVKSQADVDVIQKDTLYKVDYYFDMQFSKKVHQMARKKFKAIVSPKEKIEMPFNIPKNCNTVAVHVRKGGGYDAPLLYRSIRTFYSDVRWPLKFPPDTFYIEQIKNIFSMLGKKRMHIHIFTDDENPEFLVNQYRNAVNEHLITYSCRNNDNNYKENTVEDFFLMTRFDCLIRPQSSFSYNAQRIGNFKIVIFPEKAIKIGTNVLIVNEVRVIKK